MIHLEQRSFVGSSSSDSSSSGCSHSGCSSSGCGHCHGDGRNGGANLTSKGTALPLFAAGISFGMASVTSPLLLVCLVSGLLSKQLMQELPQHLKWFRLASYLCLIVVPFATGPGR